MTRVRELPAMSPRRGAVPVRAKCAVLALGLGLATAPSCASPERDGTVETKAIQLAGLVVKIGAHLQEGASDGGLSEAGAAGNGGGAGAIDAGPGLTGGGGLKGDAGAGGLSSTGQPHSGLTNGGCDIGASGPSAWSLTLLFAFLIARRRRGSRRSAAPGAKS